MFFPSTSNPKIVTSQQGGTMHCRLCINCYRTASVGLATEFRSGNILQNSLGTDSVIPRKKVLIPTEFRIPRKSPFRSSEWNGIPRKNSFPEQPKKLFVFTSKIVFSGHIFDICGCRIHTYTYLALKILFVLTVLCREGFLFLPCNN